MRINRTILNAIKFTMFCFLVSVFLCAIGIFKSLQNGENPEYLMKKGILFVITYTVIFLIGGIVGWFVEILLKKLGWWKA